MTTLAYPTTWHFRPDQFEAELRANVLVSTSPLTGAMQTVQIPGTRWIFRLTFGNASAAEQAEREAWFSQLEGMANRAALWHHARPLPRGTRQTDTTLASSASSAATSLSLNATTGQTLLKGDMLAVGGQLLQVIADATAAAGVLTVSVRPSLRAAVASLAAVTLVRPTGEFILTTPGISIGYEGPTGAGFMAEFTQVLT
jgi:hypothetical protein